MLEGEDSSFLQQLSSFSAAVRALPAARFAAVMERAALLKSSALLHRCCPADRLNDASPASAKDASPCHKSGKELDNALDSNSFDSASDSSRSDSSRSLGTELDPVRDDADSGCSGKEHVLDTGGTCGVEQRLHRGMPGTLKNSRSHSDWSISAKI